jgi:hypothetical protein
MTRDEFWKIVAKVGWGTKHTDYDEGKKILMELLPEWDAVDEFRSHLGDARRELVQAIEEWEDKQRNYEGIGTGDDGFMDLTNHIVGLGKKEWKKTVANPKRAYKRARAAYGSAAGYKESFSYCVPYESDYLPQTTNLRSKVASLRSWILDLEAQAASTFKQFENLNKEKKRVEGLLSEAEGNLKIAESQE